MNQRSVMSRTPSDVTTSWLHDFEAALAARDPDRVAALFAPTSFWRDLVAFTWNITTAENRAGVRDLAAATSAAASNFRVTEAEDVDGVPTAYFTFETAVGRGSGLLRLTDEGAFTLLTTLDELKGHEETRPKGVDHGARKDRVTWTERRTAELENPHPEVVVIGGGQGGIALGARLRQLGIDHLVVDKHERPGDQWRSRYKSLCLHDPVWYDHLPYIPFPTNWPVFAPKDKIGDWLEMYTRVMEVNYWGSTTATNARWDDVEKEWTVTVDRAGQTVVLHPKHLVFALGVSGKPNVPVIPGQDVFAGEQHHSSQHPGPDAYKDRKVVVIGSNNSAFDICGALWEVGADVTMVQRSSTHIVRSDSLMEIALGDLYSERAVAAGVTTHKADTIFASLPYRLLPTVQIPVYEAIAEHDRDFYQRLEKSGFRHDWGDDGSGLFLKYLRRGSGYYIDVGAAELVASGEVKLAQGQVVELTEHGVRLDTGQELPADVVVYATGYSSMNGLAADIVGQEMADAVGKVWGLGSDTTKDPGPWEGEERNMWKPTRQEGLWFHGGNLHQSRYYSLYLALQLKARLEGIPTPVYALAEVHHTS
ncbi:flavin-containing monooxygenase [Cryptosporangium phraense]|uniref:NAD(P)/FAD-dependent oxidoreductase n=1 Tax=Cryptosporangium phraense TaxID=2593070 RepID=A0A545AIM8_9ACTN|nr:NAD(P)/FAD-dependent oxidoreductase [Cryptosporangium phraense]